MFYPSAKLLLLPLALLAACQATDSKPVVSSLKALEGTWLNAHEENRGDTLVYRPNTYKFPPARGRTGFAIEPYGRFTQYDIAPTDGLEGRDGTWTATGPHRLRIHLEDGGTPDYTLEVISLKGKVLTVRQQRP
ncbi:hypothetical protein Q5H93_17390 [Hymenobacter sp. ASUV-10]|uniref:Lipocalin-like domain-containing protein n=1 Tax=Hymenobacter aranciens TaxID=3063996 RepID=A0ABT9BHP0_9BACT|nr:hypothetical protein [Hymenobacter sp. ASUV-10]MDO7876522.1 hypothetical protein [Hymenobacter sp. ASUV-10]